MKHFSTRLFSALLAITLVFTLLPPTALPMVSAATASDTYAVGDILEFGSYPQTKVTDESLITTLNAQVLQADNTVTYNGVRYKRVNFSSYTPITLTLPPTADNSYQDENGYFANVTYWFIVQPIRWRVLSHENCEVFVVAENILDAGAYHQSFGEVSWADCTLRA